MKISVVIPAYNEEEYLPATLESVKKLKRKPDEIVLVNCSSTDHTAAIGKEYGARVITIEKKTIGYTRQKGLEAARGDVIAFTDADTIVPNDWLNQIETMLKEKDVVGIFGASKVYDGPWWYKFSVNIVQPMLNTFYYRFLKFPAATGQNMAFYRDKAILAGGIPEQFRMFEDQEIANRLQRIGRIIFRQDFYVLASGRRGKEGFWLYFTRVIPTFVYYFFFRRSDNIGFPDIR